MNPEQPTDPRQALEPSLTALLLGELPDDQERFVRQAIETDPELAKTFERLKQTTALIREIEAPRLEPPAAISEPPKLSDARRQELLQRFKTVHPSEFEASRRQNFSWVVPVAAAGVLTLFLAGFLLPHLSKSRALAQRSLQELKNPTSQERASGSTLLVRRPQVADEQLSEQFAKRYGLSSAGPASEANNARKLSRGLPETLQRSPAAPWTRSASVTIPETPDARPQSPIVLPVEPTQSSTQIASTEPQVSREWSHEPPASALNSSLGGVAQKETTLGIAQNPSAGLGGDLGGAPAEVRQRVPVLGDTPLMGRLFRSDSLGSNSIIIPTTNGAMEFLGYDDPGAFVPQAQMAGSQPSVATPASAAAPIPHYRFLYSDQPPANAGSEPGVQASNTPQEKPKPGTSYGGGAFGGYATIQPHAPRPGQQVDVVTIQGVGEVPVLKDRPAEQPVAALSTFSVPGLASVGKTANVENSRPLTLAELDDTKRDGADQVREKIAVASRGENSNEVKKEPEGRFKTFAVATRSNARTEQEDAAGVKSPSAPAEPLPEIQTLNNPFSTFSLNVSDVSFKLAAASLEQGKLPDAAGIRSEEFINAFDYRDPEPAPGQPLAFAWERASYPFAQNRELLRLSIKTAAAGRPSGKPLNIVLLLDNSGSMERADRVQIIHEALRVLAGQLQAGDILSVVTFARTARLWVDGVPGDQAGRAADELSGLTPQGGTNLEEAMNLAYATALRHYLAGGVNRVVLLTDGAANLGATNPEILKRKVETNRQQGIALDCFGIGWEGYNDDLLEVLTRNGDGRYGFLNSPEEAATEFAGQLAGALRVAAADVKVQVEFNPNRVTAYRQIGYARHQLTKEQFRDNTVNAAAIGAAESGTALYCIQTNPQGDGPIATVRVRYRTPGTTDYQEHEWAVPYTGHAVSLEQASPAMRLAGAASAFSEWLAASPYAAEVTPDGLLNCLNGVSSVYGVDPRPQKLEWMIRQAKALSGK